MRPVSRLEQRQHRGEVRSPLLELSRRFFLELHALEEVTHLLRQVAKHVKSRAQYVHNTRDVSAVRHIKARSLEEWDCSSDDFWKREDLADVFAVQPFEFLEVKDWPGQADALPREGFSQVSDAKNLAARAVWVGGHRERHHAQIIQQRFGRDAQLAVTVHAGVGFAFGEFGFVGVSQQRRVNKLRQVPAQCLEDQHVNRCAGQPLLGANDVGHTHVVIVTHRREMIGRQAIGFQEHLVVQFTGLKHHVSAQHVFHHDAALERGFQTHDERFTRSGSSVGVSAAEIAVAAVIPAIRGLRRFGSLAPLLEFSGRVKSSVRRARFEQRGCVTLMQRRSLGLDVRRGRPADDWTLVWLQTQPSEHLEDAGLRFRVKAGAVGILNAHDERPAVLLGENVVVQRLVSRANVRIARRTGRDSGFHEGSS